MKKLFIYLPLALLLLVSCVSQKKFAELEALQEETKTSLDETTDKLNTCDEEKADALALVTSLQDQVNFLKENHADLIDNLGNLTTLSQKGADNLEKSLESMKEKDLVIKTLNAAINKKDSVTLALITSLKSVLGNLSDEDIQINVEKGAVFVSISDKLLFRSGSYYVSKKARGVLGKVAKVVMNQPELEFMVEGHTDSVPIKTDYIADNWDLSVKRATSIVRILEKDFGVPPQRMTAAGRGSHVPLFDNDSAQNRAKNRRTRIVILPKLGQFYDLVSSGLKAAAK